VDTGQARDFIGRHHHAVLMTWRADGRPQMSPVLAVTDAEGRVVVSSREAAYKTRNVRRRPYAALCVWTDRFFGPWVQVEGPADVLSLPDAMEPLVDYYRRAAGETDWDRYREAMVTERRVLIRVVIERAGPDASG
jgi:PPOX class probable F420-dependent enzyme